MDIPQQDKGIANYMIQCILSYISYTVHRACIFLGNDLELFVDQRDLYFMVQRFCFMSQALLNGITLYLL